MQLLSDCGLRIDNGKDTLRVKASNFDLEIYYLRNSDIPQYLYDGVVDLGVIGENLLVEYPGPAEVLLPLGFAKCRLSLALPTNEQAVDLSFYQGKKIATSYPVALRQFLEENQLEASIHRISGSVEIAPGLGLADAICDLVSTGNTLYRNGLREDRVLLRSQAVLVRRTGDLGSGQALLDQLLFRMQAVIRARKSKYILLNAPNNKIETITGLLPVLKSPTVLPLALEGWSSVHSVIEEERFWAVIDDLKAAGAEGILVMPINTLVA